MDFQLYEYNLLELDKKMNLFDNETTFLMDVVHQDIFYSLYSFKSYYIEVLIDDKTNKLIDIIAFNDLERLDKYLDTIVLI